MTFDALHMFDVLDANGVEFVVLGGLAANTHGSPRITHDLDICYRRTPENLEKLAAALRQLGAKLRGVDEEVPFILDAETLRRGDCFTFVTEAGPLDILGTPSGSTGFDALVEHAIRAPIRGYLVSVASLADLIAMKRAAGRPKDKSDLEVLEAIADRTQSGDQAPNV